MSNYSSVSKSVHNQTPVFCPWTSRAPLATSASIANKSNQKAHNTNPNGKPFLKCHHACSVNHQLEYNTPEPLQRPSIQQSSNQFLYFLRLMQLFPDVHPATLHTALVLCKNDFFCAVDKLLYAKKCKQQIHANRAKNLVIPQNCYPSGSNNKINRHRPYYCVKPQGTVNTSGEEANQIESSKIIYSTATSSTQLLPIDASNKSKAVNFSLNECITQKVKVLETRHLNPRNIVPSKACPIVNDLQLVGSPQCHLPIEPLSPILQENSLSVCDLSNKDRDIDI